MLDAIKNRRSIRFMKKETIPEETLNEIISAGFHAPSGHNNKGWHVYVTENEEKLKTLSKLHKWTRFVSNSSAVICVCYDTSELEDFWIEDCAAFMENMLLQATEEGLGSCWIGVRGIEVDGTKVEEKVRDILNIDPSFKILSLCILGKASRSFNFTKEINLSERIHRV